jgi:hypothetical protein
MTSMPRRQDNGQLGMYVKITEVAHVFCYLIQLLSLCINIDKKMGWATFWAHFSQTRLVTLIAALKLDSDGHPKKCKNVFHGIGAVRTSSIL